MNGDGNTTRHRRRRLASAINVTPMVDVMLVLLVIFMVAAPLLVTGIAVRLPKTGAAALGKSTEKPLTVSVSADGDIYIQDQQTTTQALIARLKAMVGDSRQFHVYVRGDDGARYGQVATVLSALRAAGFSTATLVMRPKDSGGS